MTALVRTAGLVLALLPCLAPSLDGQNLTIDTSAGNSPYALAEGTSLTLTGLTVGTQGGGQFTQTGGDLTTNSSYLGYGAAFSYVQSGGTHTVHGNLVLSYFGISASGSYTLTGGLLQTGGTSLAFNTWGPATFNQSGGIHRTSLLRVADSDATRGIYKLSGGLLWAGTSTIGDGGAGTFQQTGGTHQVDGQLIVSDSDYVLDGLDSQIACAALFVGTVPYVFNAWGYFYHNGGTHKVSGTVRLGVAGNGAQRGYYSVGGGALSCERIELINCSGVLVSGGTATVSGAIVLGPVPNTHNLENAIFIRGGTLHLGAGGLSAGPGGGRLNFDGGTLTPDVDGLSIGTLSSVTVDDGGAVIDTAGHDFTFTQPLLHLASLGTTLDGGLRKLGAGLLRLCGGTNTYNGPTRVEGGTLEICPGGVLSDWSTSVGPGATLLNNGSIGAYFGGVTVEGTLRSTSNAAIVGGLHIASGGVCEVEAATLQVQGPITNAGTLRILRGGSLQALHADFVNDGLLDLISGTAALPAGFVNHGIVLDSSAVRTTGAELAQNQFIVRVASHDGHRYQLQRSTSLANEVFAAVGPVQSGATGAELTFSVTAREASGFYRVVVDP